ncbi:MAG: hypothetical protein J0H60_03000 [Rhizobiales bacterium]|nr:hypothetical protein [Hyphomicrobiales bacterium]
MTDEAAHYGLAASGPYPDSPVLGVLGAFLPFDPQLSDGKPSDVPKGFGRNESMHAQVPAIPDTFHQQSSTSLKNQSKERHLGGAWEAAAR